MSEPSNSSTRNAMTDSQRKYYDWGWQDNEERIIKLLEEVLHFDSDDEKRNLFALITGEQK